MLGLRTGLRTGLKTGLATGLAADQLGGNPMASVTKDAISGKFCPSSASEWATTLGVAGLGSVSVRDTWLLQLASGNDIGVIAGIVMTAANTPGYAAAVTGWARKAVTWALSSTSQFTGNAPVNFNAVSGALLVYQFVSSAPGATKSNMGIGSNQQAEIPTTGVARAKSGANTADGSGGVSDGNVRPWLYVYNKTASTAKLYTEADKIIPTFTASGSSTLVSLGSSIAVQTPAGGALYMALLDSANAELSDTQWKSLLGALAWNPLWS